VSGLAALFHRDGRPVDEAPLWAMLEAIRYRGPDGLTVQRLGAVALGHAKLAVTPEDEREQQPIVSPRSGCVLIADARLDNREELLARLPDRPDRSSCDGELILRAYEAWELDAPAHLLGDFAIVLWDPRLQRLVCARDSSAQRSLFYRDDGRTLALASEIHQLLQDPQVPIAPNDERIVDSLVPRTMLYNESDRADTFYAGISALPAAHLLVADRAKISVRPYWHLEPPPELRYRTSDEYDEHFRQLFFDVVQARLRTSRPIGAMLSGGLDSSLVVCTAHELIRAGRADDRGFKSFSFVFDGLDCDERPLIEDIQAKYGFEAQYLSAADHGEWLSLEPEGFWESPKMSLWVRQRDPAHEAASRAGVRVLLTGDLGDSLMRGSPLVFDSLLRQGRLLEFWRRFWAYRARAREPLRSTVALHCLAPLLPLGVQKRLMSAFAAREYWRNRKWLIPTWMPEPLRDELGQRHLQLVLRDERLRRFSNETRHRESLVISPPDRAIDPFGWPVEVWRPFTDRRLQMFLLAVPPEQKFAPDGASPYVQVKQLARRGFRGILPESIRTRTRPTAFNAALCDEMRRQWPRYTECFGPAARPQIVERGYVDQASFWLELERYRDREHVPNPMYLFSLIALEVWLRAMQLPRDQFVKIAPRGRIAGAVRG
jgi:asparagine synthase (glutamine-hydrolysing)